MVVNTREHLLDGSRQSEIKTSGTQCTLARYQVTTVLEVTQHESLAGMFFFEYCNDII